MCLFTNSTLRSWEEHKQRYDALGCRLSGIRPLRPLGQMDPGGQDVCMNFFGTKKKKEDLVIGGDMLVQVPGGQ